MTSPPSDALVLEDLGQQHLPARRLAAVLQQAGLRARLVDFAGGDGTAVLQMALTEQPRLIISSLLFASGVAEHLALFTALKQAGARAHCTIVGPLATFAWRELLERCSALDSVLRGEAGRGCYHACAFCLPCAHYHASGPPVYRQRSVDSVASEIETLHRRGVRLFLFDDEQFLPPASMRAERVAALARELERRALHIAFTIKCRPDDVNEGLFGRLRAMGLIRAYVGVEAGGAATLRLLGKGTAPEQSIAALQTLDRLGLVADFRTLLFHPWSTLENVAAELDFLQQVRPLVPTLFSGHEVEVYPGTPLAARLRAERRGAGDPWPLQYTLPDPRAELLRRLSRVVFSPAGAYAELQRQVTQAWFDLLLTQRLEPERYEANPARRLREAVGWMNARTLHLWREMLAFACAADIYDAALVNERAAAWAGQTAGWCTQSEEVIPGG
ncbi:MAG TPA: B12-binding domain-containing radical SAM protein [Anaerolineae bacterium]|nr:B12-binding domain-containing radical SAM protein [Anaerolineae bacterium]HOR00398.1 B12-binding domain-containing radical SAM protein [Anaerolineae bacterium]HPL29724.1 B12-binding domain-containing radical SAM protein [Anaerolineae bacterium]